MKKRNGEKIITSLWDVVEYLVTEEDMTAYFEAVLEVNEPALIAVALEDIEKVKRRPKKSEIVK